MTAHKSSSASSSSALSTRLISTFEYDNHDAVNTQELNTKNLSQEDFKLLRKADPFMYYSIPRTQRDSTVQDDIDSIAQGNGGYPEVPRLSIKEIKSSRLT